MALVRDPRVDQILTGRPPVKRTTYRIPRPSSAPSVGSLIGKQGPGDWETVGDTWKDVVPAAAAAGIGIAQNVTDLLPGGGASPIGEAERYAQDYWAKRYSPEHQAELARQEKEKAAVGSWSEHPLDRAALLAKQTIRNPKTSIAEMVAQYAPVAGIGALAKTGALAAGVPAAQAGAVAAEATGAALGVGAVRTGIYDTTYEALRKSGVPETEARARAERAQSYTENPGLFATAAVAGKYVAKFGEDEALIGLVTPDKMVAAEGRKALEDAAKGASVRGLLTGFAREAATEAPEEFIQNVASNVGAQRAGADVSPWEGAGDAAIKAGLQAGPMGAAGHFGGGLQARATLADLNATAVPSRSGEPGENPDILGDPVLDAIVGRRPAPPAAPPARFGEEEALSKLGARPPAPEAPPEFAQSDLQRTVDARSRVAPIRDMVSRVRDEAARRAQIIREGTPEELDAYLRDSVRAVQEANLRTDPATDPTVVSIVLSSASEGLDPTRVLRAAGIQNAAAVVRQINETNPLAIFKEAQAQDLARSQGAVRQRQAEEAWASDPKTQAAMEAARYQNILAKAVAMNSMKPLVEEAGLNPGQADKALKRAKRAMASEGLEGQPQGVVEPGAAISPLVGEGEPQAPMPSEVLPVGIEAPVIAEGVNPVPGPENAVPAVQAVPQVDAVGPRGEGELVVPSASRDATGQDAGDGGEVHGESVPPSATPETVVARGREFSVEKGPRGYLLTGKRGARYEIVKTGPNRFEVKKNQRRGDFGGRLGGPEDPLSGVTFHEKDGKLEVANETPRSEPAPASRPTTPEKTAEQLVRSVDMEKAFNDVMDRLEAEQAARDAEQEALPQRLEESVRNTRREVVQREPAVVGADNGARGEGVRALLGTQDRPGVASNANAGPAVADEAPRVESFDATGTTEVPDSREVRRDRTTAEKAAQGHAESVPPKSGKSERTVVRKSHSNLIGAIYRAAQNSSDETNKKLLPVDRKWLDGALKAATNGGVEVTYREPSNRDYAEQWTIRGDDGKGYLLSVDNKGLSTWHELGQKPKESAAVDTTESKPQEPSVAAEKVTDQIERVVNTEGVKSAKEVHERVMSALQEELEAAKKISPFKEIEYRTDGMRGNTPNAWIGVDGRGFATLKFEGLYTISPKTKIEIDIPRNMTHAKVEPMVRLAVARHLTPGAGSIRVQIPGDGTFTISRNIVAIEMTLDRIRRGGAAMWKSVVGYKPGPPRETPKTAATPKPPERPRPPDEARREELKQEIRKVYGAMGGKDFSYLDALTTEELENALAKADENKPVPTMADHLATIDAEAEETRKRREAARPSPAEPVASKYSDFTAAMSPMERGKAVATLEKEINTVERGIDKRGPLVEKMVADGFKVTTRQVDDPTTRKKLEAEWERIKGIYPIGNPSHPETIRANEVRERLKGKIQKTQRRLGSDNYFWTEDDLGKTAMDYAEFLIAQQRGPEASSEKKPERADLIEKIVAAAAAGRPKLTIHEVFELKGTDGKWHGAGGMPVGVRMVEPVERRSKGFGTINEDGIGVGVIKPTREAQEQRLREIHESNDAEFRKALEAMPDERLKSQAEYWLKEEAPKPVTAPKAEPKGMDGLTRAERRAKDLPPNPDAGPQAPVHPKSIEKLRAAIADVNVAGLRELLHPMNKRLRAMFTDATGIALPKGVRDTWDLLGKPETRTAIFTKGTVADRTFKQAEEADARRAAETDEDRLRREVAEANAKMHAARTAMEKATVTLRRVEGNVRDMNPNKGGAERVQLKRAEDAFGDATEAYRAKRRELVEATGDEAQKLIVRARTYDSVDKAKMREIITAAVNAHEDAKGLTKKERDEVIEKLSSGELSYAWWHQISTDGLEKSIKVNVKGLAVDRAVASAVKKVKAMDGLEYRTGYKQSGQAGILRDLKNASTVDQVADILKEAEAANELGLEKKRQEERKAAEEREADRLKAESLKVPIPPEVRKEIQTLTKGEYEALTMALARDPESVGTTGSQSAMDKLRERGYVEADSFLFTPAGKKFATEVQRYDDRLKFGVPISERAPTKGTFMNATEKDTKMIASKFEGREFHSEGHWLVAGKLPEKRGSQPVQMNERFGTDPQNLFSKVLNPPKGFGEEVKPVAFYRGEYGSSYAAAGDDLIVMSNGGIYNGKYLDYILALHPGATMSAINADSQLNFRKDGKVVGVVMGIKGPPPAGAQAIVDQESGKTPSFSRKPSAEEPRDLILQHNLTAANLIHADKMGGLAVPSMAVGKVDMPLEGFGEITLLGNKSLADPRESGMQVFSGDIYSPRYPTIRYKIRKASVIDEALKESNKAIGYSDWQDEARRGGIEALSSSNPNVVWTFLRSKGIEPDVRLAGPSPERMAELRKVPGLEAFFGKPTYQNQENPEFRRLALEELKARHSELDEEERRILRYEKLTDDQKRNITRHLAYELEDAGTNKVDRGRSRDSLRDQLRTLGLEREFETFRRDLFERAGSESKIFKGFTNSGNERTIPHTLENVVAEMKRNMKAGEGFSYGPGTVRGAVAPRLKSLQEIRNAKDRIVSKEAMAAAKEEVNTAFWEAAGHLPTGEGFGAGDRAVNFMVDVSRMGFPRAEREYGWKLSEADRKAVGDFMTMLQTVPTEYFEAKLPRAVGIGEFAAAVVPSDADPKAIAILEKHGLKIERYDRNDPADRRRAIKTASQEEGMSFERRGDTLENSAWENYNDRGDAHMVENSKAAYRDAPTVKGAQSGIRVVDFQQDVSKDLISDMVNASSSAALSARVQGAVRMIQAHVPGFKFGGFTPAGNLHGVNVDGMVFLNQLATHQIAVTVAAKEGIPYHEAFARAVTDVLIHEAAHYNEAGHGSAFQAEIRRIESALGPVALEAIRRDFMKYASDTKNRAQNARMYEKALPGWREGERRGREAAARAGGTVRTGADVAERLYPRPRSDTGDAEGASGEGDRSQGRLFVLGGDQAEGLAAPAAVRGPDGTGVEPAYFARKPPAPPGQLLEEETNAQRLQRGLQDRLNRLTLGEVAVNARKGITETPSLANRIFGVSPRVENAVAVAEHSILNPILEGVKKNGLDFDLLGDYAKGDAAAIAKVAASKKQSLYDAARDQIKGVFDRSDAVRLATGIDDEETIAAAKKKRGPAGVKITKEHPLYEAVRELESSIFRAEHNRAMENLADFVEKNGVPEFGMVRQGEPSDGPNDGQNSILLKRNGETWSIDLADDKMAEAIKKLNTDQLDVMTRTVGAVTRWVSRINTLWSPTFTLKNKIRDVGNAVLSSMILNGAPNGISRSVAFKVAAGQVPAWKGTREYMRNPAGKFPEGSPAWWAQQAHKNAAVPGYFKSIESIDRIESRLGSALKASQRQNALRDFGAFLMGLAQAGEASTRVSVYRALVEEGMSPSKAGDVARGTLDVNKRGEWAKAIGAFSPFFNSSVQGTARLVEMVRSPDPAVRRRAQATMASLVTGGLLVGAALAAWGGDDDQDRVPDSDQVPEWDTQRNLVIPWLGGTRLRIPLPQGFSAPFYAGFMLGKTGRGNATAKQAAGNIGTAFYDQFAPISSPFGVAQPLADVARNQKFSGGPIRPIRYPGMLQPSSQMAFKSTSEAAKGVASGLNRLTGGDEAVPGLVDIAPGDLEYLAKAGTGGLGKFLSDAYTASESLVRGETPKRVPLISDFVTDANAGQRSRFYEQSRDVDQAESRLKLVEGEVRRGVLQAAVPGMDFSRTPLSDLREATAGVSFSPEQRARFRSQDRALMALKPMFDSAAKTVKAIDAMPNGPEKDAAFERIALKVNRAYQAAIRGGSQ